MTTTDLGNWDDTIGASFRWQMPENHRGFRVEIEDTSVNILPTKWMTSDEAQWLASVWPEVLRSLDSYTAGTVR